jgi:hypothetical protein
MCVVKRDDFVREIFNFKNNLNFVHVLFSVHGFTPPNESEPGSKVNQVTTGEDSYF